MACAAILGSCARPSTPRRLSAPRAGSRRTAPCGDGGAHWLPAIPGPQDSRAPGFQGPAIPGPRNPRVGDPRVGDPSLEHSRG
jgi:hypothetical protein